MIILIDPGHGGDNRGAQKAGYDEAALNLRLCTHVLDHMTQDLPCQVYATRDADVSLSHKDRSEIADRLKADAIISVHHNAASNDRAWGSRLLHWPDNAATKGICVRSTHHLPHQLRHPEAVQAAGDKYPRAQALIRAYRQPVVLFEALFMSSPHDIDYLKSIWYLPEMATTLRSLVITASKEFSKKC